MCVHVLAHKTQHNQARLSKKNTCKGKQDEIVEEIFKSLCGQTARDRVTRKTLTIKLAQNVLHKYGTTSSISKCLGIRRGYFAKCAARKGCINNVEKRKLWCDLNWQYLSKQLGFAWTYMYGQSKGLEIIIWWNFHRLDGAFIEN